MYHALFAVRHDGFGRRTLTANLAAPFAARGERVAWAELDQDTYRVVVRNMATGKQWIAAKVPRCVATRCFRIDGVTLADGGVVFSRGAIGFRFSLATPFTAWSESATRRERR